MKGYKEPQLKADAVKKDGIDAHLPAPKGESKAAATAGAVFGELESA